MAVPYAALFMGSSILSGAASIFGGFAAARTAKFNAWQSEFAGRLQGFNIDSERKLMLAEAAQRHNDRLDLYRENLSANIASFAAAGRDIGGTDRSVAAFLERQREVAAGDTSRSDFMAQVTSQRMTAESLSAVAEGRQRAAAMRAEGKAAAISGLISGFTTIAGGLHSYNQIRLGAAPTYSSLAPSRSIRPRPNPFY
jgi:hypothetical protein